MKNKWLLFAGYNPQKNYASYFLAEVSKSLDSNLNTYDNLLLLGDFNSEINDISMREFMDTYNLKSLIKEPTCFKSALNPSCIDLILTNQKNSFQNSTAIETGISDFHKMTVTVLKTYFQKQSPTIIRYRNYKKFDNESFCDNLKYELEKADNNDMEYETFKMLFMRCLDKYAPMKSKLVRANNAPFMNKRLSKSIMLRSALRNKLIKNPSLSNMSSYKIQRNIYVKSQNV